MTRVHAKGQAQLLVVVVALSMGVFLSQIPDFTTRYVLGNSFQEMEKNQMRYESLAHSYKYASTDVNYEVNYSDTSYFITNGDPYCQLVFEPSSAEVVFDGDYNTYGNLDCNSNREYVTKSRDLLYPRLPFYEVQEKEIATIITEVEY